jgi:hypothetical protein
MLAGSILQMYEYCMYYLYKDSFDTGLHLDFVNKHQKKDGDENDNCGR